MPREYRPGFYKQFHPYDALLQPHPSGCGCILAQVGPDGAYYLPLPYKTRVGRFESLAAADGHCFVRRDYALRAARRLFPEFPSNNFGPYAAWLEQEAAA